MQAPLDACREAIRPIENNPTEGLVPFSIDNSESSISERFERIVRRYPDRLAVKVGDHSLTYGALNRYANRIARAILAKRAPGSEPIALLLEQGIYVIAAVFGVLKAAKFYVILDPSTPRERTAYMLENSQAGVIITNTANLELARALSGRTDCLNLDHLDEALGSDDLCLPILQGSLASILYTSGSTGKPKGVAHNHRSQLHTVMVNTKAAHIGCEDKLTLLHSLGFGSAQAHVFQSLLNGASLNFFDVNNAGIPRLAKWLRDECISVYHSPPSVFRELAAVLQPGEKLSHLRLIRLTGESMTHADYELYKATFSPTTLLQVVMNSTEANIISSFITDGNCAFPDSGSPCGYAVEGKEILLLDDDGRAVVRGEPGEIAVKSAYLPSGYWDPRERSGLGFDTASQNAKERTILTGDIGRIRADGFLIHMGRKDSMVKIRGFRVEIVEIERALLSHPLVKDAAVKAWERAPAEKYLVGYLVALRRSDLTVGVIRAFLASRLPDYMIPSTFVFLDSLPLTNGKLDRTRLTIPDRGRPQLQTPYLSAGNELERQLVALWEDVLDVRLIGVNDNFFDLGGHSLAGARIISEVHRQYGMDLPLQALFAAPTIAQLAAGIKEGWRKKSRAGGRDWKYLFELQAGDDRKPLFFFPGGGGSEPEFFVYAALARHLGSEYPVYGLRARGADGSAPPHSSVKEMASAYLEEIRAIQPTGPYYLIGECAGGVTAYDAARQLRERGEEVALLALLDVERPTLVNYWRYRVREMLCISLIKFHWENLRRLEWKRWPAYLRGEGTGGAPSPSAFGQAADLLRARAQAVLDIDHLGKSAPHVERARTHYRRVVRRYRPGAYAGRMEIVACEKLYCEDPTLGWSGLVQNRLHTHQVPGNHDTYLREHVHVTAQQLSALIEEAQVPAEHGAGDEQLVAWSKLS
jgi:amino acid adenylation domain-containing protein